MASIEGAGYNDKPNSGSNEQRHDTSEGLAFTNAGGSDEGGQAAENNPEAYLTASGSSALDHSNKPEAPQPEHFSIERFILEPTQFTEHETRQAAALFSEKQMEPHRTFPEVISIERVGGPENTISTRNTMSLEYQAANGTVFIDVAEGELNVRHMNGDEEIEGHRYIMRDGEILRDSRSQKIIFRDVPPIGVLPAEVRWLRKISAMRKAQLDLVQDREMGLAEQPVGVEEMSYILGLVEKAQPKTTTFEELMGIARRQSESPFGTTELLRAETMDVFISAVDRYEAQARVEGRYARQIYNDPIKGGQLSYNAHRQATIDHPRTPVMNAWLHQEVGIANLADYGLDWRMDSPPPTVGELTVGIFVQYRAGRLVFGIERSLEAGGIGLEYDGAVDQPLGYDLACAIRDFLYPAEARIRREP